MLNVDILFSLLEKRNIKQSDLSKATGISTGNISDWKKGKSFPSAEKLVLIADFLGCSTDYLLGRIEKSTAPTNSSKIDAQKSKLLSNYDKLNDEGQNKLVGYSEDLVDTKKYVKSNTDSIKIDA